VHGDFHPWNILFQNDCDFAVLDRSRGEWGDPADDVAPLTINYLFDPREAPALRSRGPWPYSSQAGRRGTHRPRASISGAMNADRGKQARRFG
jgi:aminoglycoside phosphotransferase (APT) family kinase protein